MESCWRSEVTNASVIQLNALNGLHLTHDVQIVVPRTNKLVKEINAFLADNPGAGKRIDTVRVTMNAFDFNAESFLLGTTACAGLYFELVDAVRTGGVPTFGANFIADIKTISNSSFLDWFQTLNLDQNLAIADDQEVEFAPLRARSSASFRLSLETRSQAPHLVRMSHVDPEQFRRFAWLPLSVKGKWGPPVLRYLQAVPCSR